jgi:iron(III) transport system ATP-binding protein
MDQLLSGAGTRRRRAAATIAARLTLENVSRNFGAVAALRDVSLDVAPGEVVALLGQSGCGKTTLLRIAAGVDTPTSGRVLVDGREVASSRVFVPPEDRAIGLMFQDYALFPHLTILKNVMFGLTALDRRSREQEARAALARVGLAHLADAYPHEVSGGEQQRAALARAIVPRPGVLLMDEPFSGLDSRLRESVRADTMSVLREAGATAIIVTHDPEEAMRISDRIVLMRGGRVVQEGSADELYDRPDALFVARFFSHLNEVEGIVRGGRAHTGLGAFDAPGRPEKEAVVVAIRPRGVLLAPASQDGVGRPGRIVSRHFLGENDLFDVAVEGTDAYLVAKARAAEGLAPGAEVRVSFDRRDVLVFPRDG